MGSDPADSVRGQTHGSDPAYTTACTREGDPDHDEDDAQREAKGVLGHAARGAGSEPPSRDRAGETRREDVPVDASLDRMRRETCDAEEEAHDEVGACRTADVHSHRADQRGHAKGSEDHADGTSQRSDEERERTASTEAKTAAAAGA